MSADPNEYANALKTAASLFDPTEASTARTNDYRRGVVNYLAELFPEFEVETWRRMDAIDADLTKAIADFFAPSGTWEFKAWIRVPGTANGEAAARERAEDLVSDFGSIEDNEPTFDGGAT
jgi:hypothetical protein